MPPGPEDLAAVTVNCLWNQEKKTTYDYIVVPEVRVWLPLLVHLPA